MCNGRAGNATFLNSHFLQYLHITVVQLKQRFTIFGGLAKNMNGIMHHEMASGLLHQLPRAPLSWGPRCPHWHLVYRHLVTETA